VGLRRFTDGDDDLIAPSVVMRGAEVVERELLVIGEPIRRTITGSMRPDEDVRVLDEKVLPTITGPAMLLLGLDTDLDGLIEDMLDRTLVGLAYPLV